MRRERVLTYFSGRFFLLFFLGAWLFYTRRWHRRMTFICVRSTDAWVHRGCIRFLIDFELCMPREQIINCAQCQCRGKKRSNNKIILYGLIYCRETLEIWKRILFFFSLSLSIIIWIEIMKFGAQLLLERFRFLILWWIYGLHSNYGRFCLHGSMKCELDWWELLNLWSGFRFNISDYYLCDNDLFEN